MFLICFVKDVLTCFETGGCSEGLGASRFFFKKLHAEWKCSIGVYTRGVGGVGGGLFSLFLLSLAGSPNLGREPSPAADSMRNNPPTSAEGMVAMAIW